ncbi:hypothetical protein POTOM_020220 [Populus tomentosa]|uniref:glucan endo-1,3-beta-D-glucosidase n=1 Tax=Populus tomentosa TaxID=118781 RepID=A0A8X7ZX27_POPTO|nr:hypothetical protein POTOM_020220 [Populus tomentosa]
MATASALALLLLAILSPLRNVSAVGVSYGTLGKNFPSPRAVLASSFPPSVSTFATALMPVMTSIVGFLADTGAPYMVNAYPYFAYRDNRDAQVDAIGSAIVALGSGNRTVKITISESGCHHRVNQVRQLPLLIMQRLIILEGGVSERSFGVFNGDGSELYVVDLSCQFCSSNGGALEFGEKMSSGVSGPSVRWCVAKPHANEKVLQAVLDLFCGPGGVGCREIYVSGDCFAPDKLHAHASYALNAYYQMHGRNHWNCDFKGTGLASGIEISNATLHVQSANFSETDTCTDVDLKEVQLKRRAKGVVFSFICNSTSKED